MAITTLGITIANWTGEGDKTGSGDTGQTAAALEAVFKSADADGAWTTV